MDLEKWISIKRNIFKTKVVNNKILVNSKGDIK